jgi:hypothetical protein
VRIRTLATEATHRLHSWSLGCVLLLCALGHTRLAGGCVTHCMTCPGLGSCVHQLCSECSRHNVQADMRAAQKSTTKSKSLSAADTNVPAVAEMQAAGPMEIGNHDDLAERRRLPYCCTSSDKAVTYQHGPQMPVNCSCQQWGLKPDRSADGDSAPGSSTGNGGD